MQHLSFPQTKARPLYLLTPNLWSLTGGIIQTLAGFRLTLSQFNLNFGNNIANPRLFQAGIMIMCLSLLITFAACFFYEDKPLYSGYFQLATASAGLLAFLLLVSELEFLLANVLILSGSILILRQHLRPLTD
jgi:uncharacterized membrane protein